MTEAAAPTASPSPEANGSGVSVVSQSLEQRSAAAFGMPDPAGEVGAATPADPASPVGSVTPDAAAQARAERRAALEKLKTEERGRVDAMSAIRERDELRKQLSEERERSKAFATYVDPSKLTKEQFFGLAEKNPELTPQELGEWLRERMANPEAAAANAATRAIDPKLTAMEKRLAEQQAVIDDFMKAQTSAKEDAVEREAAEQFYSFTRENAATSPYAARFLEKHGAEEFYKLAQRAAQDVPPHGGAQAILDEIEENLSAFGAIYSAQPAEPQRRQASPTSPNPAAAQAPTTVSNTLAQQRTSVVDEDGDWAALPFEERSARLFR